MALLAPLFLAILAAVVAFGRVYGAYQAVAVASHTGARLAATGGSEDEVRHAVIEALELADLDEGATISLDFPAATGEPVTVDVRAAIANPVRLPGLPDPLTLNSRTVMRSE